MVTKVQRWLLLVDKFAVDTGPNNVSQRALYPLAEFGIFTRVLRAIAKYAHLALEMTRVVQALLSFWQSLRFAQTLAFLAVFRKLVAVFFFHN
jgi:hypothetical protein